MKGAPDIFFERANGKLAFAEYTKQQEDLFGKLSRDLGKCLSNFVALPGSFHQRLIKNTCIV
jgi:hypothetical protein